MVKSFTLTRCADALRSARRQPDDAWCVDGHYAGDLAAWVDADGVDLDGDCLEESMADELAGLAELGSLGRRSPSTRRWWPARSTDTVTTGFAVNEEPVCEQEPESGPKAD